VRQYSPWENAIRVSRELGGYVLSFQKMLFPYFVLHDHIHARNVEANAISLLSISEPKGPTPAEDALLRCAANLHDIGMALPLRIINDLRVNLSTIDKDTISKATKEGKPPYAKELIKNYGKYFVDDYLRFPESGALSSSRDEVKVVREIHPWISARYVEKFFRNILEEEHVFHEDTNGFVEALSTIIRWHSSKVELHEEKRKIGGYLVDLGRLAAIFRLSDALDFSRARAKYVFDYVADEIGKTAASQLKHWIFKLAVKKVEVEGDKIRVELLESGDELLDKGNLIGVVLFELIENTLGDYSSAEKYIKGLCFALEWPSRGRCRADSKSLSEYKEYFKHLKIPEGIQPLKEEVQKILMEDPSFDPSKDDIFLHMLAYSLWKKEGYEKLIGFIEESMPYFKKLFTSFKHD